MVSLFGFVSIAQSLVRYSLFEPRNASPEAQAIRKAFLAMAEENHFRVDEETGLFHVNVFMTPETLSRYPATYFDQPLARAYAAINPDFRTNGSMVGLWLPLSADNLMSVARTVLRKLVRGAPPGHAPG
ncbi:MAG TPA: hypothetical protein VE153_34125, partial [Myxococcus sp.]|nr:hypothetical protein [Myxococcus sp.]